MNYHQFLYDSAKEIVDGWISHFFPKEPDTPAQPPAYISKEAREAIDKAKEDAVSVAELEKLEDEAGNDMINLEGGPRTTDNAPGAHGVGLDEPMEAASPMRQSPRTSPRRQLVEGPDISDVDEEDTLDRIGELDTKAARVMVRAKHRSRITIL